MRVTLFILAMIWGVAVQAVTVSDLYRVSVPVQDQTSQSRADAVTAAFHKVLVKVSGTRETLDNALLADHEKRAESYISSLRYERQQDSGELRLEVNFMPAPLQKLLGQSGAPVWGASRPLTALWLVEDSGQGRTPVSLANELWGTAVSSAMNERGVPVLFPAWDLDDEMALPLVRLWGLFEEDISRAAVRYSADGYLAGRILSIGDGLSFAGYSQYGEEYIPLQFSATSIEELASMLADHLAETLSDRYAVVALPSELAAGGHVIRVAGVDGFTDYRRLLDYLSEHVAIRGVRVLSLQGSEITLSIDTLNSWAQAWDVLALDRKLQETEEADSYVWLP